MRIILIGRAVHDVNPAAVGLPARDSRSVMFVGVGDAAGVFFLVLVLFGIRSGVAALPESFDKVVALFVVRELLEGRSFLVSNDPDDVFVEPLLVDLAQFD